MPASQAIEKTAGYLVLGEVTVPNVDGDASVHLPGTVLSAWEVADAVKERLANGDAHSRVLLEPLTDNEVANHREKATALEGDHFVDDQHVSPPWNDYVGLHPQEIIKRMHDSKDKSEVERVKLYERGGLKRLPILSYSAPTERAPWVGYDDLNYREVLDKLQILSDESVHEVLAYESSHRKRPAILSYEPESKPEESHTEPDPGGTA